LRLVKPVISAALLALVLAGCASPLAVRPAPAAATGGGGVASADSDATAAGLEILRAGGGAMDAAVAVALALAVVHPIAGNLGGGGFAVVRTGDEVATLDFRETAPAAARRDMFLGPDGKPIPDASLVGPLAAGVPGTPAGLRALHDRFGRLPWRAVVEPAIRLAGDGFAVSPRLHDALAWERDLLARFPETAAVWLPGGAPPPAGSVMRLPELAATLRAYADRGPEAITSGAVAAAIEAASTVHGGILTAADLADYRPVWRTPLRFRAFGWDVATMDLPSSGGIILGQTLGILERLGWNRLARPGPDRPHLLLETWRRAYADRFLLGDLSNTLATAEQLLAPAWVAARAAGIDRSRATPSTMVGRWPGGGRKESDQTTHISVVDGTGTLVALTTTLNGWFGCGLYVPGAGFLLNNEMDDFATAPGAANMFGLVQGEANVVSARTRMLSSMAPTIAWSGAEAVALGSRRGSRIPTATVQVLLNLIVDGDLLQAAIERPRIHHQWLPDEAVVEPGALDAATRAELERRGHTVRVLEDRDVGEVHAVRRRPDGRVEAVADTRGPGAAGTTPPAGPRTGS
jgi:gamma-glutamyltranspeptidase/glutathione hydrolase